MSEKKESSKVKSTIKFVFSPLLYLGKSLMYFILFGIYLFILGSLFSGYFQSNLTNLKPHGYIIAKIKFEGLITDFSAKDLIEKLKKAESYNQTKAILLEINSPGGAIGPTQEIYYELLHIKKKKHIPIVVYLKSIAASGGYYISLPADKIVSLPGTITGSIGVYTQWTYLGKLLDKLGIETKIIKAGKYKDIFNPFSKPTSEKIQIINQTVQDFYNQFLEAVSKHRNIPLEKVKTLAEGRIYTGNQAQKLGLVDYVGDYYFAVNLAKKLSNATNAKVFEIKIVKPPFYYIFEEGKGLLKKVVNLIYGKNGVEIIY
ncbi:MAG TPA: signal peptide peptidase SppA [Desulfurobacteriaceae bacterium]|nr:signal peptide peptidase SppA [Desulfurobacteriaceae bacterium]